jgi:protein CpxP
MIQARTALVVAILLVLAMPLAMLAQSEAPPAQPQGQPGEHQHMGRMGGPPNPQQHLDHLASVLNLADDQKAKIKPILEDESTQMQNLRKDTSLSPEDRHTKMRDIHQNTATQVRALLTPEQQAKLDSMQQRRENMGRGKGRGQGQDMGQQGGDQQQKPPQQ